LPKLILPITDGRGRLLPQASYIVMATMVFPQESEIREQTVNKLIASHFFFFDPTESMFGPSSDRARQGEAAGNILLWLLSAPAESASVKKAVYGLERGYKKAGIKPHNEKWLRQAWSDFKSVCHLWAARDMWLNDFRRSKMCAPDTREGLPFFLALAETLRAQGESRHIVKEYHGKIPSLSPDDTWQSPADLKLPPCNINLPGLTPWAKKELSSYKSPS